MNMRSALIAAALLATPVVVQAQPIDGFYIGAGGGLNYLTDTNVQGGGKITGNLGFAGLGNVGYGFGNGFRVELEGNYRHTGVKVNPGNASGNIQTYGPMVNALYDMDVGIDWAYPYIGAGVGYQWGTVKTGGVSRSGSAAAAQAILGAAFPVGVDGLSVTAEGRAQTTLEKVKFSGGGRTDPLVNLSALIGLRYAFGAAPAMVAAPTPAPAPAPARSYLVFFDWDKADLTPRARQIIADAAAASTKVATTRIEVAGHADRTGTAQYNQGLSMRRAQAVAAELVRLGVARNAIAIQAFGDTKPLVATAVNTREPQNRRVEIVLK